MPARVAVAKEVPLLWLAAGRPVWVNPATQTRAAGPLTSTWGPVEAPGQGRRWASQPATAITSG